MQFKHPEILYALFLLIIPILVHLFQLQRFKKVPFTNVHFLKKIEQQTRKSSRLKKFLTLLMRILALACLIIAFAQPYFSNFEANQQIETSIYVDNSLSMQAKGEKGELLKNATQTIIENFSEGENNYSLITNNSSFKNTSKNNLKNELIKLGYSSNKLDLNTVLFQLNNLKSDKNSIQNQLLISDFQKINISTLENLKNTKTFISLVQSKPKSSNNIYIDSVFVKSKNSSSTTIGTIIKSVQAIEDEVPVSLNENKKLIGKATAKFVNTNTSEVDFTIQNQQNFNGTVSINVNDLTFDNNFYFSVSNPKKINVLSIGNPSNYLNKIYTKNEFNFVQNPIQNLNYNQIQNQHLIILNELETIPSELISQLNSFFNNDGNLLVIPASNSTVNSYNSFFQQIGIGKIQPKIEAEHQITNINFEHPVLKDVFEKRIRNFQYPKSSLHYPTSFYNATKIVSFDNANPFVSAVSKSKSQFYWVASPLNKSVSNFTNSPLIVPVFYNIAKTSFSNNNLFFSIKDEQKITINTSLGKDEVVTLANEKTSFIPLQQSSKNKVELTLQQQPLQSGFYNLMRNNELIQTLAFNYNREESELIYENIETLAESNSNIKIYNSVEKMLEKVNNNVKINWLFKWFLAFSVLFLIFEMLILKYFKI